MNDVDDIDDVVATFHNSNFVGPLKVISKEEAASALKDVHHELSIEGLLVSSCISSYPLLTELHITPNWSALCSKH